MLKEGDELPKREISEAAKQLAEDLHHEARGERILTIIELALRAARPLNNSYSIDHWKDETPNHHRESNRLLDLPV